MSFVGKKHLGCILKMGILYDLLLYEGKAHATCESKVIL